MLNLVGKKIGLPMFIVAFGFCLQSCQKPPGAGGKATIKGKVILNDFDSQYRYKISTGPAAGQKVYIVYGNNTVVGKDIATSYDGSFAFRYLTKGHYKVFVNSIDTNIKMKGNKTTLPVMREVDITSEKQAVTVETMTMNK